MFCLDHPVLERDESVLFFLHASVRVDRAKTGSRSHCVPNEGDVDVGRDEDARVGRTIQEGRKLAALANTRVADSGGDVAPRRYNANR